MKGMTVKVMPPWSCHGLHALVSEVRGSRSRLLRSCYDFVLVTVRTVENHECREVSANISPRLSLGWRKVRFACAQ